MLMCFYYTVDTVFYLQFKVIGCSAVPLRPHQGARSNCGDDEGSNCVDMEEEVKRLYNNPSYRRGATEEKFVNHRLRTTG